MFNKTVKFATCALVGAMLFAGGSVVSHADNTYETTGVAGVTLSLNTYINSIAEDDSADVTSDASAEATETTTSKKNKKFVAAHVDTYVNVRKGRSTNSEVVGQMYKGDVGKVVKKYKNWTLIKSGNCKGYVKNDYLYFGDQARKYANKICNKIATVTTTTLNVRKKKSANSECLTQIPIGGEYIVCKEYDEWVKISIDGDLKGYVSKDYVDVDFNYGSALTTEEIQAIEEANAAAEAQQTTTVTETITQTQSSTVSTIKPTVKSTISNGSSSSGSSFSGGSSSGSSTSSSGVGSQVAAYACQFVGNPYRYGGTSLTNGTDCSGFTQSVYAHFGYSLNRTAASQTSNGTSVSLSNLQPGDLLFYNNGGGIGHVAIYIGNGTIVHASNPSDGIKYSAYNYRTPCKAVRIAN